MTSLVVKVGIWKYAPFKGAILNSIEILNKFIKSKGWDAYYELLGISPLKDIFPKVDMVIFDGGEDVNPALYGERNQFSYFSEKRDVEEYTIIRYYKNNNDLMRFSGVCRGHQLLNVFHGGTLWQDISKQILASRGVLHPSPHKVTMTKPTASKFVKELDIRKFFTHQEPFYVSSLHHQAIKNLGKNFIQSLAWTYQRGYFRIIEGVESVEGNIRAVQSHPEFQNFATDGSLFSYLSHVDYFLGEFMESTLETELPAGKVEEIAAKRHLRNSYLDMNLLEESREERVSRPSQPRFTGSSIPRAGWIESTTLPEYPPDTIAEEDI